MAKYVPMQEIRDAKQRVANELADLMGRWRICVDRRALLVPGESDWITVDREAGIEWSRLVAAVAAYGADAELLYPPLPLYFS